MYVVLELEVKLTMDGGLGYTDPKIFACNSLEDGLALIQRKKAETLKRGFFTRITRETSRRIAFQNGTAYKEYWLEETY